MDLPCLQFLNDFRTDHIKNRILNLVVFFHKTFNMQKGWDMHFDNFRFVQ